MSVRTGSKNQTARNPETLRRSTLERLADDLVRRNVNAIAELEGAARQERSGPERVVDAITGFTGSVWFLVSAAVFLAAWIGWNVLAPEDLRFDPFPFGTLTLIASAAAIFLTAFILMTQNRLSRLADRRHHLDLQISMLAEQEITKVLELVEAVHERLGLVRADPEIDALKQATQPEKVVEHIEKYVEPASAPGKPRP